MSYTSGSEKYPAARWSACVHGAQNWKRVYLFCWFTCYVCCMCNVHTQIWQAVDAFTV